MREGGQVIITAELTNAIPRDLTVYVEYSGGDAIKDKDYSLSGNFITLVFKAGERTTSEAIILSAIKDDIKEPEEFALINISNVTVNGTTPNYVDIGDGAQVFIEDVFPTAPPPAGKDENSDIRPDPLISPNEDGIGNETFVIYNISAYPNNEVRIFNRWGNEVFRMKNYDNNGNSFRGKANRGILTNTEEDLVDGVYYYLIYTEKDNSKKVNKGYIILKRKK